MSWCCSPNMNNQNLPAGSEAASAKSAIADKSPSYKAAVGETTSKKSILNSKKATTAKAKSEVEKAEKAIEANEAKKANAETSIEKSENANDSRVEAKEDNQSLIDDNNERIAELNKDGSPDALAAAETIKAKNTKLETDNLALDKEIEDENKNIITQKGLIKESEDDQEAKEEALDEAEEKFSDAEDEQKEANIEYEEAVDAEENIKDELVDDYPETYGKLDEKLKSAKRTDASNAIKRKDDIQKKKKDDTLAKKKAEALALVEKEKARIKALKAELDDPTTGQYRRQEITSELWDAEHNLEIIKKKIPTDSDKALDAILASTEKTPNTGTFLKFDAKTADGDGQLEEIISKHMQPKNKHAYMGEFPAKLANLDWMVKTIDRPKVDIESVEQVRFNVKRQYPVKYNIGDVSVTFWDDVDHKTVTTLYKYFTGNVWNHKSVGNTGTILLRDSILIPQFKIFDLSVETNNHLEYKFENAVLTSFDFDASDDEGDETVYTVQAVFKVEKFDVIEGTTPRVLNAGNSPVWL